jgi:hypothetical protein
MSNGNPRAVPLAGSLGVTVWTYAAPSSQAAGMGPGMLAASGRKDACLRRFDSLMTKKRLSEFPNGWSALRWRLERKASPAIWA